jgi:hypothetical protein
VWRRGDFISLPLPPNDHALRVHGREPVVVPAFVVEFVWGCEEFRPLEEHLADYAEAHGWGAPEIDALQRALPVLMEQHALVSASAIVARQIAAPAEAEPPLMSALGVPTGGERWPLLHRCLASFHENLRTHGHTADFLVSENSANPQQTAACRERLKAWQGETGARVRFAGEAEKRAFIAELVRLGACASEVAEFALLDPMATGFSCGANRNALLLQEAGRVFASIDDDVHCRLASPPGGAGRNISGFSDGDPYQRWLFADRASARHAAGTCDLDFVRAHQGLLGCRVGDALRSASDSDFAEAGDFLTRRLLQQTARVRATFSGHVGDPGIPTSAYYLYYKGDNRARLVASEAHYRSVFPSRSVFSVVTEARIGDATVSPGMAMGLDHRTVLPPFFPVLHAEDFSFGAALWQGCPEAVLGHLPLAVAHEPPEGKSILTPGQLHGGRLFIVWEFAHLLRRFILHTNLPLAADAAQRLELLGREFEELGELPPSDFMEVLRQQALSEAGERLDFLHKQLHADEPAPDYWVEDVEALVRHLHGSATAPGLEIPLDLPGDRSHEENRAFIQAAFGRYGTLLRAWPGMVEATQSLRERGVELMPLL